MEGRHPQRAEGSAIPAARRSHVPANSGCVWSAAAVVEAVAAARRAIWRRSSISSSIPRRISTRPSKAASTSAEQKAQEIDDALKKLDELAKREEDLAQQQRNGTQTAEQKWQQEMLQREAQQLQQQMEQQLGSERPAARTTGPARATGQPGQSGQSRRTRPAGRQRASGQVSRRPSAGRSIRGQFAAVRGTSRRQPPAGGATGARPLAPGQRRHEARRLPECQRGRFPPRRRPLARSHRPAGRHAAAGRRRPPQLDGPNGRSIGGPAKAASGSRARPDRSAECRSRRPASSRSTLPPRKSTRWSTIASR